MPRFETQEDRDREEKAIKRFVKSFSGTFQKLGDWDLDYQVFNDGKFLAYAEVKGRRGRHIHSAYPLPVAVRKLFKMQEKKEAGVLIWACIDGIIYGKFRNLKGRIQFGGWDIPRKSSANDQELMVYYDNQKELKSLKY
jgi:hypothetical protein|tara:strand:- start:196 stop:612 length:417 start_codon:yes stop_codon:yes gene_type:complete